jgi:AraC-like DNA-binding protein
MYPGAVLRRIRLEYAKRLLTERDMTLREIARQCGYRSQNTFCVAFRRAVGMAPKKFQRQYWLAASHRSRKGGVQTIVSNHLLPLLLVETMSAGFKLPRNDLACRAL